MMKPPSILLTLAIFIPAGLLFAEEKAASDPKPLIEKAVKAVGGEDKRFKLIRIKERFNSGSVAAAPDKAGTRESVIEPPGNWWLGGKDRTGEPAKFDVWGWTLGALVDPKSVVEVVPDVTENEKPAFGLRVSGTVTPAMELYFDATTHRLVRLDWRGDIYRFSDWKEHDGTGYPSKTVIFKTKATEPWFFHEILELERLTELPAGLVR